MSWYYWANTGEIHEATGGMKWFLDREIDLEKAAAGAGVPQKTYGPFATQDEAQAFASTHPSWLSQGKQVLGQAGQALDVPGALTSLGNTLVKLVNRALEAVAGIVLLAIAANVILKQTTGVDVAGRAARAGKRAATAAA